MKRNILAAIFESCLFFMLFSIPLRHRESSQPYYSVPNSFKYSRPCTDIFSNKKISKRILDNREKLRYDIDIQVIHT